MRWKVRGSYYCSLQNEKYIMFQKILKSTIKIVILLPFYFLSNKQKNEEN